MVAVATQSMKDYSKEDDEVIMMVQKSVCIDKHTFKEVARTVSLDAVGKLELALDDNIGYLNGRVDFPILILRMDGEDLQDFITKPSYESEMKTIFKSIRIRHQCNGGSEELYIKNYLMEAVKNLTVDHGMPPSSDTFVMNNIIQPSLEDYVKNGSGDSHGFMPDIINDDTFLLEEFEKFGHILVQHLKEEPIIVAHTQITFDGSKIKNLLSNNKSDSLEKALDMAVIETRKDMNSVQPRKEILRVVLDQLGPLTGLPPYGAIHQIDIIVDEMLLKMKEDEEENKVMEDDEDKVKYLKMLLRELLEHIMLELEANKPISVSSNSVIHT